MKYPEDEMIYDEGETAEEERVQPELQLSRQERRWIAMGALKAALMIASVYLIGAALLIWFLLTIWN